MITELRSVHDLKVITTLHSSLITLHFQGTGSYPLPPQGLHLRMRHIARARPLTGPCFTNACLAYSEQVGVKRQDGGVYGVMQY